MDLAAIRGRRVINGNVKKYLEVKGFLGTGPQDIRSLREPPVGMMSAKDGKKIDGFRWSKRRNVDGTL